MIEMLDFIIHVVKYLSVYLEGNQKNVIFQLNHWPLANIASKYWTSLLKDLEQDDSGKDTTEMAST